MDISVVVPLFNEEESLPELYAWIERVMQANGFSLTTANHPHFTVDSQKRRETWL